MPIRTTAATLVAILLLTATTCLATTVTVGSGAIYNVDGTTYNLITDPLATDPPDYSGLMWEETSPGSGTYKACLCSMFSFRALQAIGQSLNITDLNSAYTSIVAGWNTDGPEHIFVDSMGWKIGTNFAYADPIPASKDLGLKDAWLTFTIDGTTYKVSSLAENYAFTANTTHGGYHEGWDFFAYRTYFQSTSGMDATKEYFRDVIRGQIVENFKKGAAFDITPVPEPASLLTMGCGLAVLALIGRRRPSRPSALA